jgi:protoheme IX farnesyltransferase
MSDDSGPTHRRRAVAPAAAALNVSSPPGVAYVRDLLSLTKPRIISLLLVTTVVPMYMAGTPDWRTVLIVLLGGYLMAGGANAVNMYFDRDIDEHMARTRLRPIPSGRMAAPAVLSFGIALAAAATGLLAHFVNVLTAALAVAGFYFYVLVYTRWLKRSTPQNIVIGGAAGAFPPLVGWAAVTGRVDLLAVYLFLIIFYWTPPHFWALALLKQRDYGRAGVPMAPLVWGERRTIDQMVWYTVILCALTLVPVALGAFGPVYIVAALLLDALFLVRVARVRRATDWTAPAWSLYKFSLLYLALIFAAMAVDRQLTMHGQESRLSGVVWPLGSHRTDFAPDRSSPLRASSRGAEEPCCGALLSTYYPLLTSGRRPLGGAT